MLPDNTFPVCKTCRGKGEVEVNFDESQSNSAEPHPPCTGGSVGRETPNKRPSEASQSPVAQYLQSDGLKARLKSDLRAPSTLLPSLGSKVGNFTKEGVSKVMSEMSLPTAQTEGKSLEDSAEVVDAIRGQKSESEWEIGYGEACAIIDNRDKAVAEHAVREERNRQAPFTMKSICDLAGYREQLSEQREDFEAQFAAAQENARIQITQLGERRAERAEKNAVSVYEDLEAAKAAVNRLANALQNIGGEHIWDILEVRQLVQEALQLDEDGKNPRGRGK